MPTRSAGSRSGRELDALEPAVDGVGEASDRQRLGQAGHALEQHVAPAEQTDEQPVQHILLADDDFAQLGEEALDEDRLFLNPLVDGLDGRFH